MAGKSYQQTNPRVEAAMTHRFAICTNSRDGMC